MDGRGLDMWWAGHRLGVWFVFCGWAGFSGVGVVYCVGRGLKLEVASLWAWFALVGGVGVAGRGFGAARGGAYLCRGAGQKFGGATQGLG